MPGKRSETEYSTAELRRLLLEKYRSIRQDRIERYYQTGRAIRLFPDIETPQLSDFRSEIISDDQREKPKAPLKRRRKIFDRTFLLIEIGLIFVLGFIFITGISSLQSLNREVVQALELPGLTPTPLVRAIVLPSGHTPPTSPGGARPNDAEIPAHLQPLVQTYNRIPIPTPAHEHATRIQIPAIGIDAPVIQGTGWEQLKKGVGQVIGTANPGENGNLVLSAHNDIFGEIFRYLDQLQRGDQFTVYTNLRAYTYVVTGWEVVEPTRVEVMNPTPNPTATLISCYPYLIDNMRIVVKAKLNES
jgi:sortase A